MYIVECIIIFLNSHELGCEKYPESGNSVFVVVSRDRRDTTAHSRCAPFQPRGRSKQNGSLSRIGHNTQLLSPRCCCCSSGSACCTLVIGLVYYLLQLNTKLSYCKTMLGSRAWFALMRRNFVFRRRHWISSVSPLVDRSVVLLMLRLRIDY